MSKSAVVTKKKYSAEKQEVLKSLLKLQTSVSKAQTIANEKKNRYRESVRATSNFVSSTCFGSDMAETTNNLINDRYHAAMWTAAHSSITRRLRKIAIRIRRKEG